MSDSPFEFDIDAAIGSAAPAAPAAKGGDRVSQFVQQYLPTAKRVGERLGVSPQVLLGQWGLETGWGKSVIPGTNNLGNIKDFSGKGKQATDNMTGSRDGYRVYADADAFADDFAGLVDRRYRGARGAGGDAGKYFSELKRGGYAEDPDYVTKGSQAAGMVAKVLGGQAESGEYFAPARDTYTAAKAVPAATPFDFFKEVAASAIDSVGAIGQFVGEGAAAVANKVTGTEDYVGKNLLKPASDAVRDSMTEGGKLARAGAEIKGDIRDPSTWEFPDSAESMGMVVAQGFGSLAGTLIPIAGPSARVVGLTRAARAAEAAGDAVKAAELMKAAETAARASKVVGAAAGGAMTGGSGAEEVRQNVEQQLAGKTHEQLLAEVPVYAQAIEAGLSEDQARKSVVNGAARAGGAISALFGAAGGAFNAKVLEDIVLNKGMSAMLGNTVASRAGRAAVGGGVGSVAEGGQELAEKVGQNAGENIGMGLPAGQDVTRNSLGDVVAGAMVGGGIGAGGGAISSPAVAPAAAKAAEPNSPLSKAAVAGNAALPPVAPAAPVDPAARLAELEAIGKGTAEQPGRIFSPEEQAEYQALSEARDATPGAGPGDKISASVASIKRQVEDGSLLDALRDESSPVDVKQFLSDLAVAGSASTAQGTREQALNRLEFAMGWAGKQPVPEANPIIDEVLGYTGDDTERSGKTTAPQRRAAADREKDLQDKLAKATTEFERNEIRAQMEVNRERKLGKPAEEAQNGSDRSQFGLDPAGQQSLEASALAGKERRRKADDAPRQAVITRAQKAIQERGGVASPAEAKILAEAGLGKPYDRIDETLAGELPVDQKLTQATGIALDKAPRSSQSASQSASQSEADLVAREQRDRSDSRVQRLAQERAAAAKAKDDANAQERKADAPPTADEVIAALKAIPVNRTAEQQLTLRRARSAMSAEQMRILDDAANAPRNLSATDKVELERLRGVRKSTSRGPARAQLYQMRRASDARISAAARDRASEPKSAEDKAIESRRADGAKWAKESARPGWETAVNGVVLRETTRRSAPSGRYISYVSRDGAYEFDRNVDDDAVQVSEASDSDYGGEFIGDFDSMADAVEAVYGKDATKSVERDDVANPRQSAADAEVSQQPDVTKATVAAPKAPKVSAIPEGREPAIVRKRRAQLELMAEMGFETVVRTKDGHVMRNGMTGRELQLDGAADAQIARQAIKAHIDKAASRADVEPTPAQVEADNYRKGQPFQLNGVTIIIENPRGSVRKSKPGAKVQWETTMKHHYGDIAGTKGADGDKVDVFVGPRPDSHKIFVIDQRNDDGSFDEHKVMMGFGSEAEARAGYLSNFDKGWDGLMAITEMTPEQLKGWLNSGDVGPVSGGGSVTINDGGKAVTLSLVSESQLAETGSPARAGAKSRMTRKQLGLLKRLAAVFGKNIQVFRDTKNDVGSDGFVIDGNDDTIYLNEMSTISPMSVFGHELMHLLRRENPQAYAALEAVIKGRVKDGAGFRRFYNDKSKTDAQLLEELISDLNGDLMGSKDFWADVFAKIDQDHAESRGIIAKLAAAIYRMLDQVAAAFKGSTEFGSARFIDDGKDVRAAFRDALAAYVAQKGITKTAMQAEVLRAAQASKSTDRGARKIPGRPMPRWDNIDSWERAYSRWDKIKAALSKLHPDVEFDLGIGGYRQLSGIVTLHNVESKVKGSGAGTKFMSDLAAYADSEGVTLSLKPAVYYTPAGERLAGWYASMGFRPVGDGRMRRPPAATKSTERYTPARGTEGTARSLGQPGGVAGEAGSADAPAASYGSPQEGSVSATGVHFRTQARGTLSSAFYGTGLRGAERERLAEPENADIRPRIFYYVDKGNGIRPEAGVGGYAHKTELKNLYDVWADPLGLRKANPGASNWERAIMKAGFDGYLSMDPKMQQGFAVLVGKKHTAVPTTPTAAPGQKAAAPAAQAEVREALMSREIREIDTSRIPGARVDGSGTLVFPADSREAANAEMERIGSTTRFSRERDLFEDDFADGDAFVEREVVVDSRGGKQTQKLGNLNSEGQRIAGTKQALQNFWNWFGDSELVDDGRPIVLYHGTRGSFGSFETMRPTKNTGLFGAEYDARRAGFFMTTDKEIAGMFADADGGNVMPLYARMENPADFRRGLSEQLERDLEKAGFNTRSLGNAQYDWEMFDEEFGGPDLVVALKKAGYDGAIISDRAPEENGRDFVSYVAFDPDQVKSATGNRGTFGGDDITKSADREYRLDLEREERASGKTSRLTVEEIAAVERDAEPLGLTDDQVRGVLAKAREDKKRFPQSEGWAPLELIGVGLDIDKETGLPKPGTEHPKYQTIAYNFNKPPGAKRAPPQRDMAWMAKVADKFEGLVVDVIDRASAGDKNAQTIVAHQTWYRNVAAVLRREYGGFGDLLADLLGATSPNTPVDTNWAFSLDAMRRFLRGDFNDELARFQKWVDEGKSVSKFPNQHKVRQASGKLYGMNSDKAMRAMLDMWRLIEPGTAPKARNFALNLIGQSKMATIDVWAARMLRRAADMVRGASFPRIPPPAEMGVTGTWDAHAKDVTGAFGFGAAVMDRVSKSLATRGIQIAPPDLQAVAWFAEKELWASKDWTTKTGEGGSFEERIAATPVDRYIAGWSIQQGERVPSKDSVSLAQARVMSILAGDDSVLAARAIPTKGLYAGTVENSFDTEWTALRSAHDPRMAMAEIARLAAENDQWDIFVSRVVPPKEANANARPGVEIYFKDKRSLDEAMPVLEAFTSRGQDGFTMVVDPRARGDDKFIGVRLQYVPEISARWDEDARRRMLEDGGLEAEIEDRTERLHDIAREIEQLDGVAYSASLMYDTVVVGKESYGDFIGSVASDADREARGEAWFGRPLREAFEGAVARYQRDGREDDAGRVQDAGGELRSEEELDDIQFSRERGGQQGGREDANREVQASERAAEEGLTPLPGAPRVPGFHGPDPRLVAVAEKYARDNGIQLRRQAEYVQVDEDRARRIAAAYEAMPHAPQDPKVKAAYADLVRQTRAQYDALAAAGYRFWFMDLSREDNAEYASTPWNAMRDIRANRVMGVFPTDEGFGSDAAFDPKSNPLLEDTGLTWPAGGLDGKPARVLANDLFRAVHDAFGHGLEGAGFRARGEENAWQAHVRLFTGPAVGAITSETRGQNSWLNYGPNGEANRAAKVEDTVFADQKTGLMPEWTWTEGRADDITKSNERDPQTETDAFKSWFGDSKVVDEQGRPLVVYHGSTHDFAAFKPRKTNPGNDFGRGIYATSSQEDASSNYAGEGPDLTDRITRRAEQIASDNDWEYDDPRAVEKARKELSGGAPNVMPLYLRIENPLVLGGSESYMEDRVARKFARHIDKAVRQQEVDTRGAGASVSREIEIQLADLMEAAYDGSRAGVLIAKAKNATAYLEDLRTGELVSSEVVRKAIQAAGYDGIIDHTVSSKWGEDSGNKKPMAGVESGTTHYIAFKAEQVKSAIGNDGNFDPANPNITKSGERAFDAPEPSRFDDFVYKMQDKHVDTKRVVESIKDLHGTIRDDLDVYLQEELFHGRAAKRTDDFVHKELEPLVKDMAERGLTVEELDEYLHARHAKEANAVIRARNPELADGGSGLSDADVDAYFDQLGVDKLDHLKAAAARVDAMLKRTRNLLVDYELVSKAQVKSWGEMFEHYVPLMREDEGGHTGNGTGQGFSIKGKEVKSRTGSKRKVVDILANIAMQRERAIVRGEKNRVSRALFGLAAANDNPDFWQVDTHIPSEQVFNPKTGLVEERQDNLFKQRSNVVVTKMADEAGNVSERAIIFNEKNERAVRMAESLKNLDAAQLEGLLGASARITRYFASVNTQYNPVFGVVNLVRDVQGAMVNLGTTELAGKQKAIAMQTPSALRGIYGDLRAVRKGGVASSSWAALWEDFQDVGGQTGYRDLFRTSEDRAKAIEQALDPSAWMDSKLGRIFTAGGALKVPLAAAQRGAKWIFDWLSDYNQAMENGVRLATYKAGIDAGLSKERAASIAKNLTVNFNRKGQVAQQAGAMYAFFNASAQGTARLGQVLFDMEPGKPKTIRLSSLGKKVVYGGMLLGSIQAMAMAAAGFGDDDPPEWARERSLIIPVGDKKYVTIPLPLGLHVIPNIGRVTTAWALSGFKDTTKRAIGLFGTFADAFNPIGNAGMSMQTLSPTALDPLVALTENRDWSGRPIARESSNKAIPGYTLARDTSSTVGKLVAEGINLLSGGTRYTAGVISPTPDQIDYLLGQVTGGVGRELNKVEQSLLGAVHGETVPIYKVPLVGRFVGNARSQASEGNAFYANVERLNELETEIKGMRKDGDAEGARQVMLKNPQAYLITQANHAEQQVQKLRKQKSELVKGGAPREQVKAIEAKITERMAALNRAVEALEAR